MSLLLARRAAVPAPAGVTRNGARGAEVAEAGLWMSWPSPDAQRRAGLAPLRRYLGLGARWVALFAIVAADLSSPRVHLADGLGLLAMAGATVLAVWAFIRAAVALRLVSALAVLALVLGVAMTAPLLHGYSLGGLLLCFISLGSAQRIPLAAAVPASLVSVAAMGLAWPHAYFTTALTALALGVLGYVIRQDWEARAATARMLAQERALRAAEAETAALAERGRIAREIHDVLAHSLSAQLVHLEAARLMLDSGAERHEVRERVVAARRMAQDGLAETRQALKALRGEFTPVGEYLAGLAADERAALEITGPPRPLPAEAGLAVRRTAQEALTNVRKHARGARCTLALRYLVDAVELEVRNDRAGGSTAEQAALAASGSGYGLLGMRERAELLGGTLEAGPSPEGGFRVLLRLPDEHVGEARADAAGGRDGRASGRGSAARGGGRAPG